MWIENTYGFVEWTSLHIFVALTSCVLPILIISFIFSLHLVSEYISYLIFEEGILILFPVFFHSSLG